jgi:hypothetical protein
MSSPRRKKSTGTTNRLPPRGAVTLNPYGTVPSSMEEEKYSEEVLDWMRGIQMKLSSAYQFICHVFNEMQLIFKEMYSHKAAHSLDTTAATAAPVAAVTSSFCTSLEKSLEDVEMLLHEILPFKISYHLIARNLIEECLAWNEDVGSCTVVLKTIQALLIAILKQFSAPPSSASSSSEGLLQTLGDALSDIVTSLQIGEDGQPLEFVAWKAGSVVCNVISTGLLSSSTRGYSMAHPPSASSTSMNISSFSPINKGNCLSLTLLISPCPSQLISQDLI